MLILVSKKISPNILPPAQKRSTFAAQKMQQKKLARPFRSPFTKTTTTSENQVSTHPLTEPSMGVLKAKMKTSMFNQNSSPIFPVPVPPLIKKKFTPKAASQFKSPLSGQTLATSETLSSVRLTPTIQALERKLQILKRAVKVKMDGEEETLTRLVKKWGDAGRDVAWEVWGLVKDSGGDGGSTKRSSSSGGWDDDKKQGKKRGFEEGWGWDDRDSKKMKTDESEGSWGWNTERSEEREEVGYGGDDESDKRSGHKTESYEEEEEDKPQDTLGTMLRQLGIAPETFGWSEDEGDFVVE